ncbi:MAG TPA: AMP-binding protein, partial [Lautropia sp.]|nr:AMP-binding protein [Lautropia sp.]
MTDGYEDARSAFRWQVPARFNIGVDACDRWADGSGRPALIYETEGGEVRRFSFDAMKESSNRLANCWRRAGIEVGDRVAILLPQAPETGIAHLAAYKSGAVAVPLFTLFGPDALQFRLADSGARILVTDANGLAKVRPLLEDLPALERIYCIDDETDPPSLTSEVTGAPDGSGVTVTRPGAVEGGGQRAAVLPFQRSIAHESDRFEPVDTAADDPAVIIYTSGTTGKPKGVLHGHRVLLGHLPGVEMSHGTFPRDGDLIWTPADWAWIGGLLDVLLPAWHHGVPVLARRFAKFDAEAAFELMSRHRVTCTFLPPTALRMLRLVPSPRARWPLALRSAASGGEPLGKELLEWGLAELGLTLHEFYGQTECNMIVSACAPLFDTPPGNIGRPALGHRVQIIDDDGRILPRGTLGHIAVKSPDPVMFLRYWNNPSATAEKFIGDFLVTGDSGIMDEGDFVRFVGRTDDVITSAGYRIGPGPIEDCLLSHPAVREAAVVGVPDAQRTEIVKAF